MSVELKYNLAMTVVETLETNIPAVASGDTLTHSAFNVSGTLTSSSTPPVTKHAASQTALVAGTKTLDLTALIGTNGATVDGTGLKVQGFLATNPSTNANSITIEPGATNPYNLFGSAFKIILQPGETFAWKGNDVAPDVTSLQKNIKLTGTGTQALNLEIVMG